MKHLYFALLITIVLLSSVVAQDTKKAFAPESRVGVDTSKRTRMTMREAVTIALENNRDIAIERENVKLNEWDVKAAQSPYDPTITASLNFDRRNLPVTKYLCAGVVRRLVGFRNYTSTIGQ